MNYFLRIISILIILVPLMIVSVTGITVGNIAINPGGDLISGVTRASASYIVNFPSSGGNTFESGNTLQMDTELDDATWRYSLVLDGIENPSKTENGPNIRLSGWELSYPSKRTISLKVKMEGTAPVVDKSEEKILVRVRELTGGTAPISSTQVVKTKMVLNPTNYQTPTPIPRITTIVTSINTSSTNTVLPTSIIPPVTSLDSQQQEIIEQLKHQNQLLEEQNRKLSEQNNLLQNLIDLWKNFLRFLGVRE